MINVKSLILDQSYEELDSYFEKSINFLKESKSILTFDFEFTDKSCSKISEIGFTFYDKVKGQTESFHFIIDNVIGTYKRNNTPMIHSELFAYGSSVTTSLENALKELNKYQKKSDVTVTFTNQYRENLVGFDYIVLQDILCIGENYSLKPVSLAVLITKCLSSYIEGYKIQPINNAGNDSVSVLEALQMILGEKLFIEPLNDYSDYEGSKTPKEIRKSRKKKA